MAGFKLQSRYAMVSFLIAEVLNSILFEPIDLNRDIPNFPQHVTTTCVRLTHVIPMLLRFLSSQRSASVPDRRLRARSRVLWRPAPPCSSNRPRWRIPGPQHAPLRVRRRGPARCAAGRSGCSESLPGYPSRPCSMPVTGRLRLRIPGSPYRDYYVTTTVTTTMRDRHACHSTIVK
jgi:hypothetical protein